MLQKLFKMLKPLPRKIFLIAAVLAVMTSSAGGQDIEAEVDAFVAEVMRCANIPGLSLTIVRDGEAGD